ncbi:hypothetical protein ACTFIT_010708 [Dictyostelium discoideum]
MISLDDNKIISINSAIILVKWHQIYLSSSVIQYSKRVNINIIKRESDFIQCEVESFINEIIINTSVYYIKNMDGFEITNGVVDNGNNQIKCLVYSKILEIDNNFIIVNNKK